MEKDAKKKAEELVKCEDEKSAMPKIIDGLKAELASKDKDIDACNKAKEALEREKDEMKKQNDQLTKDLAECNERNKELEAENERLKEELENSKNPGKVYKVTFIDICGIQLG